MTVLNLKPLGFDLAYLAMLTMEGLKPLSRWEPGLTTEQIRCLSENGLRVRKIRRIAKSKKEIYEHVFSLSDDCINEYLNLFDNQPLSISRSQICAEGRLFGYPECCIFSFIERGYRENGFNKQDQNILFHWACKNCSATKLLLPEYRRVYEKCLDLFDLDAPALSTNIRNALQENRKKTKKQIKHITPRILKGFRTVAPVFASLLFVFGLNAQSDPHLPPLNQYEDSDLDYLTDTEENILSTNPFDPDEDKNKIPDGIDLAKYLANLIENLPYSPSSNKVYAIPHMAFGLETCNVCGEQVNMGFLQIVNPMENYEVNIPFIVIHYLEHGSFSYSGSIHNGKVKPPVLKTVLESDGLKHFIPEKEGADRDNDGLLDHEEKIFGVLMDNPDTNGDTVRDGIEIARKLLQKLKDLPRADDIESGPKDRPFVIEHPMDGIETCPRCGESVVMDWWLVYNPKNKLQISIPSMALHYMAHGGFRWEGGQMFGGAGRVSAKHLNAVLDQTENGHILPVSEDLDEDGLKDTDEGAFLLSPQNPDTDENGVKDGADLAKVYWQLISKLPRVETNGTFVIEHPMRGFVYCPICGNTINMGFIEIINRDRQINWKISYLKLHFLEHGSLSTPDGDYTSPMCFSELFKANITLSRSATGVKFRWLGEYGKKYAVLVSETLNGPWSILSIHEGADKEIEINESSTSEKKFFRILIY